MSYPRKLHFLIVEDESDPIDTYCELLRAEATRYPSVEPVVARSYDDAVRQIQGSQPFHIVILDLNLPLATRHPPAEGVEPGQQLLEMLAQREAYPVPVVLIVSGRLNATRLSRLHERLVEDFWYGVLVNKGPDVAAELTTALEKAQAYCDVGVHIADSTSEWFPPLSPREEDLLRRCVLKHSDCLGLDLAWWAAEMGPSNSRAPADSGPTKILMGRFLLDDGMEASRPNFFKLEPVGNASYVQRDAAILDQKLRHVKVKCSVASRRRSLLVTQSVTNGVPVSLDKFLQGDAATVQAALPAIVDDVIDQLNELGTSTDTESPTRELLWKHHDRDRIAAALQRHRRDAPVERETVPLSIFDALTGSTNRLWAGKRSCTHGDLTASNIAIDMSNPAQPHAFIFDAAGVHADVDVRDLATLEVTTLLFNASDDDHEAMLDILYGSDFTVCDSADRAQLSPWQQSAVGLVAVLRDRTQKLGKARVYAMMVADVAFMQLGGLIVQPSPNKVASPLAACALAHAVCRWISNVAPEILPSIGDSPTTSSLPANSPAS